LHDGQGPASTSASANGFHGSTKPRPRLDERDGTFLGLSACPAARPRALEAREFEAFLARERMLADRSLRVFSLLVLNQRTGQRSDLGRLAGRLMERLRATDLLGSLDSDRLALLLTDTGPQGAQVVANWVDDIVADLGMRIEPTVYVYPSVQEATPRSMAAEDRGSKVGPSPTTNGRSATKIEKRIESPTDGKVRGRLDFSSPSNGFEVPELGSNSIGPSAAFTDCAVLTRVVRTRAPAAKVAAVAVAPAVAPAAVEAPSRIRWPMEDLWPRLSMPTPRWKRALDVTVAVIALVALMPLFALVALAITIESPGPVIFRQRRAGTGGHPFWFYKFRSMHVDAEQRRAELMARNEQSGPIFKIHDDPRITRVGRLLRRWSVDELPQLWNIVKGDISLVGPRPPTLDEVAQYDRWQRRRLNITGGITCIWQVSGRSQISFRDWMRMDMCYVAGRSVWMDLNLLLRTLPAVISGRGAY
jgi:lipopolysaccharide/colanic/teichoic acid biosynthesis glycosyltransferase